MLLVLWAAEDCGGTGCSCEDDNTPSIVGLAVLLSLMKSTEELDERRRLPEEENKIYIRMSAGLFVPFKL